MFADKKNGEISVQEKYSGLGKVEHCPSLSVLSIWNISLGLYWCQCGQGRSSNLFRQGNETIFVVISYIASVFL
jgi:hypothetical protein